MATAADVLKSIANKPKPKPKPALSMSADDVLQSITQPKPKSKSKSKPKPTRVNRPLALLTVSKMVGTTEERLMRIIRAHPEILSSPHVEIVHGHHRFQWPEAESLFTPYLTSAKSADLVPAESANPELMTYGDARAKREVYTAKAAQLDYETKAAKLIPAAEVAKVWTDIAVSVQKSILSVPDRITPLLVGETDHTVIYNRIATELKYALKNLAYELKGTNRDGDG
jgi:hypothetical protein